MKVARKGAQTAKDALSDSIKDLGPDPSTGLSGWHRASALTGIAVRSLYSACAPEPPLGKAVPIKLEMVEMIDRVNVIEGGVAHNLLAWQARHAAAIKGHEPPQPSPKAQLERAVTEVRRAIAVYSAGHGEPTDTYQQIVALQHALADFMTAWTEREASTRNRRRDDIPERPKPQPGRPRLVKDGGLI